MKQKLYKSLFKKIRFIGTSEGTSMIPIIYPKDGLYIKPTTIDQLKFNDIVIFQQKRKLIIHRIIYKKQNYINTKGDNNPLSDGKIYPRQIIGKVYQVKRNGKVFSPDNLYLIQSTLYFQEITKIIKAFNEKNINYIILKGLPLHLYYEKGHPKRLYADCDVLVNRNHFAAAEKIITANGYKKSESKIKTVENNYFKNINGLTVIFDLHLEAAFLMTQFSGFEALYPQNLINQLTEELLKNKKKVKINNEFFFILNVPYLILYLSLHFFHHNFRGAFRLDFLDKVIRKSQLSTNDWQKIASTINNYQLTNFVYPVFVLLKKYYNTPLPNELLKSIQPTNPLTRKFINKIVMKANIFDDEPRVKAGINRFKHLYYLSPNPWYIRMWIFVNLQIVYSIYWVLKRKLSSFFSTRK